MIKNFADKETEKIYNQEFSKKLPQSIQRIALKKTNHDRQCYFPRRFKNSSCQSSGIASWKSAKGNTAFELMHNTASVLEL